MTSTGYAHSHEMSASHRAAERVVPVLLECVGPVRSVVDLGGGDGGWLRVFRRHGVERILLVDCPEVESHLVIDREAYVPADLERTLPEVGRFDLAVSLECAEHLDPERAEPLVEWITGVSDRVVFSAAIPGQGGAGHRNERSPDYWRELFRRRGFARHDILRPRILNDASVPWWYRQNLFLFTGPGVSPPVAGAEFLPEEFHLVHRQVAEELDPRRIGLRKIVARLGPAFRDMFRRRLGG